MFLLRGWQDMLARWKLISKWIQGREISRENIVKATGIFFLYSIIYKRETEKNNKKQKFSSIQMYGCVQRGILNLKSN